MLDQALVLGALILSGSSLVAWIKFWMEQGDTRRLAAAAAEVHKELQHADQILTGKIDLHISKYSDDRLADARHYISHEELTAAEVRFGTSVENIRADIKQLIDRVDRWFEGQHRAGA